PEYGWFKRNSSNRTHTVGLLEPNAWGLYDLHGNVWEWCSDRHGEYPKGAVSDPTGPKEGSLRVFRGGCWRGEAAGCRSAVRDWDGPSARDNGLGFRVALSSPSGIPKSPEADSK
ncbi:MAG: formylglycine-generating enzyme family protein, partial [Burkholderiaceae bacterium]